MSKEETAKNSKMSKEEVDLSKEESEKSIK